MGAQRVQISRAFHGVIPGYVNAGVTATHIREKNLDDPSFDVVWRTAERLGVAVCTHGGGQAPREPSEVSVLRAVLDLQSALGELSQT